ncbi:MAG: J domain-containing protein [Cyanobacteriota bacterium]
MDRPLSESAPPARRRFTLELSLEKLAHIDALKKEWGLRKRGDVLERLLDELFAAGEEEGLPPSAPEESPPANRDAVEGDDSLDDGAALVLVGMGQGAMEGWRAEGENTVVAGSAPEAKPRGRGIDLPGFVRRRSQQLRRSLRAEGEPEASPASETPLPRLADALVLQSLEAAESHWLNLFGQAPNAAVVEAAMSWLAHDIWPHADLCEGRIFTWTTAMRLMSELGQGWSDSAPTLERIIITAGVLEDPFSADTLPLRIPTLIHRFVKRFRRRQRGTSFQTLESTMTLHGALKQLQLPTDPGERMTLTQIRDAYREMALKHHPDSGGSLDTMRRLNEAYQLLKELYRPKSQEP